MTAEIGATALIDAGLITTQKCREVLKHMHKLQAEGEIRYKLFNGCKNWNIMMEKDEFEFVPDEANREKVGKQAAKRISEWV